MKTWAVHCEFGWEKRKETEAVSRVHLRCPFPFWDMHVSQPLSHSVINPRAALLSNYEVLDLLKQLEADHIARTRTAQRLKKEEEEAGHPPLHSPDLPLSISENLRTIEVEVSDGAFCAYTLPIHRRLSSTSLPTISPHACRPQRASSALRKTSPLSTSPRPKNYKSSILLLSSRWNSMSCVLL
jgi:hypothetical protein